MVGTRSLVNIALLSETLYSSGKTTEAAIGRHGFDSRWEFRYFLNTSLSNNLYLEIWQYLLRSQKLFHLIRVLSQLMVMAFLTEKLFRILIAIYTAMSIKVVPRAKWKSRIRARKLLGIANKFINLLAIPCMQQPFALVFDFSVLLGGKP